MRIIAGPCQHESLSKSLDIAVECQRVCERYDIDYYFKASYDKANRTNVASQRGRGMRATMDDFVEIKRVLNVNILTDFHSVFEINSWRGVEKWYNSVDVVQIPAFLCRQTDLITTAARSGKIVNIKKGQFLSPKEVEGVISKCTDAKEVWITERGTSFGYNTLINDFVGMQYLLDMLRDSFIYDVTHSVQTPGGEGDTSGGDRKYVPSLCRAGAALGITSFFLEVHDDPDNAPSDGPNMIKLQDFESIVDEIHRYRYTG